MPGELRRAPFTTGVAALALALASAPAAWAAFPVAAGPEFAVGTAGAVEGSVVTMNERGEAAVVWLGECAGVGPSLCLRTFDAAGDPQTAEIALDLRPGRSEVLPAAALTSRGVLWLVVPDATPVANLIVAHRFNLRGGRLGGGPIVSRPFGEILDQPAVAIQPGGGAIVAWRHRGTGADLDRVSLARLSPIGEVETLPPAGSAAGVADPAVATSAGGDFLVAWQGDGEIVTRGYTAAGESRGAAAPVAPGAEGPQAEPAIAAHADGGWLVAWHDLAAGGDEPSLFARPVTREGAGVGSVKALQSAPAAGTGRVALAGLAEGFAGVWHAAPEGVATVFLRFLDLAGVPGAPESVVAPRLAGDTLPAVASDGAGVLLTAWRRLLVTGQAEPVAAIFARRYVAAPLGACDAGVQTLCLGDGRFSATVTWRDPRSGDTGVGIARPATGETGFFTFFDEANLELVVKALDGRPVNGFHWLFYGALTDVDYELAVTDTATGERRFYDNPAGQICGRGDTRAFPLAGPAAPAPPPATAAVPSPVPLDGASWWALAADAAAPTYLEAPQATAGACASGPENLCLLDGRFQVEVAWIDQHNGGSGLGHAVPFSDASGLFWFFAAPNLELVVKALDGRPVNGHFWIFYGGLSDVEYTITVTDTESGAVVSYRNPPGQICGRGDTAAF